MNYLFKRIARIKTLLLLPFITAILGCSFYSFSSSGASHIKTVAIPIFQDETAEFGIKEKITDAIVEKFTRDNTLQVTGRRRADSIINGKILTVKDEAGAFTTDESVKEIQVFLTVSAQFEDLKKRKLVWQGEISQWGTFNPDSVAQSRDTAIDEAIDKIATDILNKSVSGW